MVQNNDSSTDSEARDSAHEEEGGVGDSAHEEEGGVGDSANEEEEGVGDGAHEEEKGVRDSAHEEEGGAGESAGEEEGDVGESAGEEEGGAGESAGEEEGGAGESAGEKEGGVGESAGEEKGGVGESAREEEGGAGENAHEEEGGVGESACGVGEGVREGAHSEEGLENSASYKKSKQEVIDLSCEGSMITDEMWISELDLSYYDHDVLHSDTKWVNDNIIYTAQHLLKELSKGKIKGWQSTQLCKTKNLFMPLPPSSLFIQILHVAQNHWVTVSNITRGGKCYHEGVFIYDSLCPNTVDMDTKKQICSFMKSKSKVVRFELMNIQMQENLNDCGLYAIACATELVYKRDPCRAHFQANKLRSHLIECLEKAKIVPFPLKRERRIGLAGRIRKSVQENVYCCCWIPNYDKKLAMVCCSTCSEWFHLKCIGDSDVSNNPKVKWFCVDCAKLLH